MVFGALSICFSGIRLRFYIILCVYLLGMEFGYDSWIFLKMLMLDTPIDSSFMAD